MRNYWWILLGCVLVGVAGAQVTARHHMVLARLNAVSELLFGNASRDFDGSNDYIDLNTTDIGAASLYAASGEEWSVCLWAKLEDAAAVASAISRAGAGSTSRTLQLYAATSGWNTIVRGTTSAAVISTSTDWVHMAITWDGTTAKFYADGSFDQNLSVGSASEESLDILIGARTPASPSVFMNGLLADVRIYDDALTAGEVAAIAAGGAHSPNLVGWWLLNTDDVLDWAGSNDGTNNGSTYSTNGPVFEPDDISGLELWLAADEGVFEDSGGTDPAEDGEGVYVWADQSGNGNDATQATAGSRPIYHDSLASFNDLPALEIEAGDLMLLTSEVEGAGPWTSFAVMQRPDTAKKLAALTVTDDLTPYSVYVHSNGNIYAGDDSTYGGVVDGETNTVIFSSMTDGAGDVDLWKNGESLALSSVNDVTNEDFDCIAKRYTDDSAGFIAEILYYDSALSSANRESVETYLTDKWLPSSTLTDNLVAHWPLGEASGTRSDVVGSIDLTDNATVTQATGKIGNAAQFTAANSEYLSNASADDVIDDSAFTWAAWVYMDTQTAGVGVLGSSNSNTIDLFYNTTNQWRVRIASVLATEGHTTSTGTWYLLVVAYDDDANKSYWSIDGETKNETTNNSSMNYTGTEIWFGRNTFSGTPYWDGRVDEVAYWDRVLTDDEISELYNSGSGVDLQSL